ncbi:MAG: class I SAM-dependent methyltransferase [Ilumatobacter sp.]|uniref:class I SAM-dependent methyltransferase n=1 Tax=Ilumatobacter sp. TaxID=1967498 RepID=UPI002609440A|nr:class I SAM-dependent methyltransferase [Ilumatobacter sp.]MDJ0768630.1 class I SAM-dependent methyltransferase [Ilumatobacter sp.]
MDPTCVLCDRPGPASIGKLAVDVVIDQLERQTGSSLPRSRERYGHLEVSLLDCSECHLQFFHPPVVGDATFYEELAEVSAYYEPLRWDQDVATDLVTPGAVVIDVGSGSGSFVETAAGAGARAIGVDFSAGARSIAGADNPTFVQARLEDLRDLDLPRADIVTAFQVLEHVEDPRGLVGSMAALVVDGGRVVVSVPNRERFAVDPMQALDCPPHHQTRWGESQLRRLASEVAMVVESIHVQRVINPARLALRMVRRARTTKPADWSLPPAAGARPLTRIVNGTNLVAVFGTSPQTAR